MKLGQSVTTIPTVGFNVETVTYKNVKFNVWVSWTRVLFIASTIYFLNLCFNVAFHLSHFFCKGCWRTR